MSLLTTLQRARKIKLSFLDVTISGADFSIARDKIFSQQVMLTRRITPGLGTGTLAKYDPSRKTLDIFTANRSFPSTVPEESLIAHEACHIAGHVKRRNLSGLNEEMLAYVVQGMYLLLYEKLLTKPQIDSSFQSAIIHLNKCPSAQGSGCNDARIAASVNIANSLHNKETPHPAMINALRDALKRDSSYAAVTSRNPGFIKYPAP